MVADDEDRLREMMKSMEAFSLDNNFRFAPNKCEIVAVEGTSIDVRLYGQSLRISRSFVYLGVELGPDGIDEKRLLQRLDRKARIALGQLQQLGMNSCGYSDGMKRSLFVCFVRSNLEYGIRLLRPTQANIKKLQQVQNEALSIMANMPLTASTAALHAYFALPSMNIRWMQLHARWQLRIIKGSEDKMVVQARSLAVANPRSTLTTGEGDNPVYQIFLGLCRLGYRIVYFKYSTQFG